MEFLQSAYNNNIDTGFGRKRRLKEIGMRIKLIYLIHIFAPRKL